MDTPIREKTPLETRGDVKVEPYQDTRHEAIKAMARALQEIGYTRDTDKDYVKPRT